MHTNHWERRGLSLLLSLCLLLSLVTPAMAGSTGGAEEEEALTEPFDLANPEIFNQEDFPYALENVLVKLAPDASGEVTPLLAQAGVSGLERLFAAEDGCWFLANLADGTLPPQALESLRELEDVVTAEYNYIYQSEDQDQYQETDLSAAVNEKYLLDRNDMLANQWALYRCGIQQSWEWLQENGKHPGGDASIVVAVIDTGVDFTHGDLRDNMWVNEKETAGDGRDNDGNGYVDDYYGVDIVAGRGNGMDDHGHGTHVAGVIAAVNNLQGTVGVAFNTKIMSVKAGMSSGYFTQDAIAKAILYAYENGADVINMSFGGTASSIAVQDALTKAYTRCVLVASAGNEGAPNEGLFAVPNYPAAYPYVLGVMSVDKNGVESAFSNYDVAAFNGVEYEVYAPGEDIVSTIPGDRYATWSGTSMAAPLVSGMAALLRSYYTDLSMYPTKFIYGQLAATSTQSARCCDPDRHGAHNLPPIVNLYDALTQLPKPDLHVSDHTYFDTQGLLGSEKNNGDGVIDAGEILALGFTLRNRWGMSADTVVTVDALSEAGVACPYVQFSADGETWGSSAGVNYGSVGTYSTQDAGKVMTGEGTDAVWTGWEKPIYVKVSPDCPNDYIVKVNVSVSAKNALDDKDTASYTGGGSVLLEVRRGTVLPQIIDQDMTLTPDNYYIIENSTVIEAGATVTVQPGTKIQFWSDDPNDAYADQYIAALTVKGSFLTQGTEEQPVEIFPSQLMDQYRVEITRSGGVVQFNGTKITNPYVSFDSSVGCEFTQNYESYYYYYRYLSNGKVGTNPSGKGMISGSYAENCAFYKLNSDNYGYYYVSSSVGCIFVDCALNLQYSGSRSYENCVFYGNNTYWASSSYYRHTSSYEATSGYSSVTNFAPTVTKTVRNPENGSTYLWLKGYPSADMMERLARTLGGHLACVETQSELDFLKAQDLQGYIGLQYDYTTGEAAWVNGEALDESIAGSFTRKGSYHGYYYLDQYYANRTYDYFSIIELPGEIRVEGITLPEENVILDLTSGSYTILPTVSPVTAEGLPLQYFSGNPNVVTVDESGVVTPVGTGECSVYVFSEDMQVSAALTVRVRNEVKGTGLTMPAELVQLAVGESRELRATLLPADTTKHITYTSSHPEVAAVDGKGWVTARQLGETVITARIPAKDSADGQEMTAQTTVRVVIPAESVQFASAIVFLDRTSERDVGALGVTVRPEDATDQTLIWESSNPEICRVKDGKLVRENEGVATLRATVEYTTVSAEVTVCVREDYTPSPVVKVLFAEQDPTRGGDFLALQADGTLWMWGGGQFSWSDAIPKRLTLTTKEGQTIQPVDIVAYAQSAVLSRASLDIHVLDVNGDLYSGTLGSTVSLEKQFSGIQNLFGSGGNAFIITEDGAVWARGRNSYGSLCVGDTNRHTSEWLLTTLGERVKDIYANNIRTFFLTESGDLYVAGDYGNEAYTEPHRIAQNIDRLQGSYAIRGTEYLDISASGLPVKTLVNPNETSLSEINMQYYLDDGKLYVKGSNRDGELGLGDRDSRDSYQQVAALAEEQVTGVWGVRISGYYMAYFATESGKLYVAGANAYNSFGPIYKSDRSLLPELIPLRLNYPTAAPALRLTDGAVGNLEEAVIGEGTCSGKLHEAELRLAFDTAIREGSAFDSIVLRDSDGNRIGAVRSVDLNCLVVRRSAGLTNGETYTLTIPANAVQNGGGVGNEALTVTFTYCGHVFESVVTQPTCTEAGQVENTCTVCGAVETETLEALGHDVVTVSGYPATCMWGGWSDWSYCRRCHETLTQQKRLPATGVHTPETVAAKDPTCSAAGFSQYTVCSVCGLVLQVPEVIPPTGHNYVNGVCSICGAKLPSSIGGGSGQGCSFTMKVTKAPSCTEKGELTYTCTVHDGESFTEEIPALEHVKSVTKVANDATCTEAGNTAEITCALCGAILQASETIEATGHKWEKLEREATCTREGYTVEECANCYEWQNWTKTAEALGHDPVTDEAVAPTHDDSGLTEGSHCGRCDAILTAQTVIPALGHNYVTETVLPTEEADGYIRSKCDCGKESEVILPKLTPRKSFQEQTFTDAVADFVKKGYNTTFWHNAILNRTVDDNVEKWLRIMAPSGSGVYGFGGNYWGTANETLIGLQIVDYLDFSSLGRINYGEYLTEAPEDTFPFVVDAYLTVGGKTVASVGNEEVTFVVKFNRDMDQEDDLLVCFGSSYPYAEYEIPGGFTDSRTWQGTTTLRTIIENGYQFWSIDGGRSAADENGGHLKHYKDWGRFSFKIDTSSAQAMIMQGSAENDGVHLSWTQDDYSTLAGYNVYRAESETGTPVKLNSSVILPEADPTQPGRTIGSFLDTQVEGGKRYYYSFTVVPTDVGAAESKPSGQVSVVAKDVQAPQIIHTPVTTAVTGSKLCISATVTDNVAVTGVTLFYRTTGESSWKSLPMTANNSKYSVYLSAADITLAGLEYYIVATDGVSESYAGGRNAEDPYTVTVQQGTSAGALGDVDGDGVITLKDALLALRAVAQLGTLTDEQKIRADVNGNGAVDIGDVLRIMQYVNGSIASISEA